MIAPNNVVFTTEAPQVGGLSVVEEGGEERTERGVVDECGQHAAQDPEAQSEDVEETGHEHQRQEARHDEVLDRVDSHHHKRVELIANLAGAEVGGDRRPGNTRHNHGVHERRELADRSEDEESAQAVQSSEKHEEVGGLEPRGLVPERDRREQHREPAQPQREQELLYELNPVGVRRADRRDHGLAGQHDHVAGLVDRVAEDLVDPAADRAWPAAGTARRRLGH